MSNVQMQTIVMACVTMLSVMTSADAADELLSGSITSQAGQKLDGVTVSAKLVGSTITTSVYTDTSGAYVFPPLPEGQYRVWAQALGYETGKGTVELSAARRQDMDRQRACRRTWGRGTRRRPPAGLVTRHSTG